MRIIYDEAINKEKVYYDEKIILDAGNFYGYMKFAPAEQGKERR